MGSLIKIEPKLNLNKLRLCSHFGWVRWFGGYVVLMVVAMMIGLEIFLGCRVVVVVEVEVLWF